MRFDRDDFFIAGATAVCLMLGASQAVSHSWYPFEFCSDNDCHPISAEEVQAKPDGYHYRKLVIPYAQAKVSLDNDYHLWEYPDGKFICFFAPTNGM